MARAKKRADGRYCAQIYLGRGLDVLSQRDSYAALRMRRTLYGCVAGFAAETMTEPRP